MFKTWGDLSWREKCAIQNGTTNRYSYQSGYSFDVKSKVAEGQRKREENAAKRVLPDAGGQ